MGCSRGTGLSHYTSHYVIRLMGRWRGGEKLQLWNEFIHLHSIHYDYVPVASRKGHSSPGDRLTPHIPHSRGPTPVSSLPT